MDINKERIDAFKIGYMQGVQDLMNFQENLPARHGGNALFQRDAYADECNMFLNNVAIRAQLRAEQRMNELAVMELEEQEHKDSKK